MTAAFPPGLFRPSRRIVFLVALTSLAAVSNTFGSIARAQDASLSPKQLAKIDGWIKDQGRDIAITPLITDILGLTKGDQTLSCRAFAAEGDGDEVHQIYVLPDGKGYLDAHFYKDKLDVYWADKGFALVAALEGIRGQQPTPTSFADAQYGFHYEVQWWTKYADAH
jgi:hypothetical protein